MFKIALHFRVDFKFVLFYYFSLAESFEIYEQLVTRLKEDKKFKEAAEILMHYLQKSEESVAVLCQGKVWRDAWKQTHCMKRLDLIGMYIC